MRREYCYTIPDMLDGCILRDVMRRELGISSSLLKRMKLREGAIQLNDEPVFVNVRVSAGDILLVELEDEQSFSQNVVPTAGSLDIRFENDDILIVSKPGNMPVHPSQGNYENSLGNIVMWHYASMGQNMTFRPINRLDRGTSGLMAIAKNAYSHAAAAQQLHDGRLIREYLALVHGAFEIPHGTVDAPICRKPGSTIERMVDDAGKRAITHYEVIEQLEDRALVRLRLDTGRTHQIRVHMAHIGHPLFGDFLYGEELEQTSRVALHSAYLQMTLPFSGETIEREDLLPQDIDELKKIGKNRKSP